MVCLGLEPGAAGWKAQTNPLSYGGTHLFRVLVTLYSLGTLSGPKPNLGTSYIPKACLKWLVC